MNKFEHWWTTEGCMLALGKESARHIWQARQPEIDALKAEVERLRNENVDLSVRVDALNDLMGYKEDDTFANTTENRKLIRELWEEPK